MKRNKKRIGVDLGRDQIRIIHQKPDGSFLKESMSLQDASSKEEYIGAIHSFLTSFMKKYGLKSGKISFTISSDSMFGSISMITLPSMDDKSLEKAIKFEIEDQGVVKVIDSYHHKWKKVGNSEESSHINIAVSVLKKDFMQELSKFKKISWDVESVELYPVTIGKGIQENALVIDYANDKTYLYSYINGLIQDINVIPSGEERINDVMREVVPGIDTEGLKELKSQLRDWKERDDDSYSITPFKDDVPFDIGDLTEYEEGIDKDILMEVNMILEQESRYIAEEVKRAIRQIEVKREVTINQVLHKGNIEQLPMFLSILNDGVDAEVMPVHSVLFEKDVTGEVSLYGMSYFATRSKDSGYMKELNFNKDIKNNTDMKSILTAVVLTSFIVYGGLILVNKQYESRVESIQTLQKEQQVTLSKISSEVESLMRESEDNSQFVNAVNIITQKRIWMADVLQKVSESTPNGMAIKKIMAEDGMILLRGESMDYTNVGILTMEMEKLGEVTIDYIVNPTKSQVVVVNADEGESFDAIIEFTLKIKTDFPIR